MVGLVKHIGRVIGLRGCGRHGDSGDSTIRDCTGAAVGAGGGLSFWLEAMGSNRLKLIPD